MQSELTSESDKTPKSESVSLATIDLKILSNKVSEHLEEHTKTIYREPFRWHLGASQIGDECKRKLWYGFRWVGAEELDGRRYRLFNRGHLEELRHAEWLRGMGFTVWTHDTTKTKPDGTHPQLRIERKCKGHFGGSLDGIVEFPKSYGITGYALLSCKTNGTGTGFNDLDKKGMAVAKPAHYIQECVYGEDYKIEHVLYMNANKNDDSLYIEVVKLDFDLAKQMEMKAESIIFSQTPPPKISENPTFLTCKSFCDFKDVCHFRKPIARNCRSCVNCRPVDGGEFECSVHNGVIPRDFVPTGCDQWDSITDPVGK